jgi:hypothetical protein
MARIFISYSRVDRQPFTIPFIACLYEMFPDIDVWYDEHLAGGDIWWEEILNQIAKCDVFVYLLSNESVTSPYCQAEFAEALRLNRIILPVQVRDRTKLLGKLRDIHYVDMKAGVTDELAKAQLLKAIHRILDKTKLQPVTLPLDWQQTRTLKPEIPEEVLRSPHSPDKDTPNLNIPASKKRRLPLIVLALIIFIGFGFITFISFTNLQAFNNAATQTAVAVIPPLIVPDETSYYVCFRGSDSVNDEYLLVIRDTTSFGLVFPRNGVVTIYSRRPDFIPLYQHLVSLYAMTTDAQSGGYRTEAFLATAEIGHYPREGGCGNYFDSTVDLNTTVPLPVSENHALLVQIDSNEIESPQVLGVVGFNAIPNNGLPTLSFQILQLYETRIEFGIPTYRNEFSYILVANKPFLMRQSFADAPDNFSGRIEGHDRSDFERELVDDNLNLFDLMMVENMRIYPDSGLQSMYEPGSYIQVEMSPNLSMRTPPFTDGIFVQSLEGANARYYLPTSLDEPYGSLAEAGDKGEVVEADSDTGQLILQDPGESGETVVVEAWLVEVCTDCR